MSLKLLLCTGFVFASASADYESLGCWKDSGNRAIATLEGFDNRLAGHYQERANAIEICYEVAKSKGYPAFAVQNGGWCAGSSTALDTYKKYGSASNCAGGKGGSWANDVYKINGNTEINGCECSDHTETAHRGKIIGQCVDELQGKFWCYVKNGVRSTCPDKKKSRRGDQFWSFVACDSYDVYVPITG